MHRILNCPIYCITSLFIIWQQCDPGLKDLLVKKIMCFPFSVLLKCQVLHFWHLLKNKMSSEIFFPSTEVTSEELGMAGLFSTSSLSQKFRRISFPQKLPIFVSLCVLTAKKIVLHKFVFLYFTDNSFISLFLLFLPSQVWNVRASEQEWAGDRQDEGGLPACIFAHIPASTASLSCKVLAIPSPLLGVHTPDWQSFNQVQLWHKRETLPLWE